MSSNAVVLLAFAETDLDLLIPSVEALKSFDVAARHALLRNASGETPDFTSFASQVSTGGVRVVIAATRECRLARALAAALTVPVIRVPVPLDGSPAAALSALTDDVGDAPAGPNRGAFATVALGEAGAKNAALLAVSILALSDGRLRDAWQAFRDEQTRAVLSQPPPSG